MATASCWPEDLGRGDRKEIPRSMIVVGAGVIGLEYASMLSALGVRVNHHRTAPHHAGLRGP